MRQQDEAGGINIAIEREGEKRFVVLHEPFEKGAAKLPTLNALSKPTSPLPPAWWARTPKAGAYEDIILLQFDRNADDATKLTIGEDHFEFTNYAWIRKQGEQLTVAGDLKSASYAAWGLQRY